MPSQVPRAVQSESELRNVLDLLYCKSREGKSFTGILELATSEVVIVTAIHKIKANKGAKTPGVDRRKMTDYLQLPRMELLDLVRRTMNDYHPKPARRKYIPKANGKQRPLGIATMLDRIIQECLRIVLEPIVEARFHGHSYGFRPYRATEHAVSRVVNLINKGHYHAVEGDIKGFFDHVNHRLLIRKLWRLGVIDKRVLAIIKEMLKAGIFEDGQLLPTEEGTPQGGILSPLIANVYLNDFDWVMARKYENPKGWESRYSAKDKAQKALKRKGKAPVFLTRYADDWIALTPSREEAQRAHRWLKKYFKHRLRLELSEEKTLLTDAREAPLKFLGFLIEAAPRRPTPDRPTPKLVGKRYPDPAKVKAKIRELLNAIRALKRRSNDTARAIEIERINAVIVGLANYWKTSSAKTVFMKMDHAVERTARCAFRAIYGNRYREHNVPIYALHNRPNRHKDGRHRRRTKTWAVRANGMLIGLTRADITKIQYGRLYPPEMTPYTKEGQEKRQRLNKASDALARPPLYNEDTLWGLLDTANQRLYNFEYWMNREYAYNQTLWRAKGIYGCSICRTALNPGNRECHHRDPSLPLDKVNKVPNLIWLCGTCHQYVEHGIPKTALLPKRAREKIENLREVKYGLRDMCLGDAAGRHPSP